MHTHQDYIILCLDVGPSMDIAPPSGGDTHLEMALRVAVQIVQQKVGVEGSYTLCNTSLVPRRFPPACRQRK